MQLATHCLASSGGRSVNEDAVMQAVGPEYALLALADGLGGHGGGAIAANLCVKTVVAAFSRAPDLSDAALQSLVDEADRAIAALRCERRQPAGSMRTTVALLAVRDGQARWAHVGDSRVYWFRDRVLMERTRDHTVSELVMSLPSGASAAPLDVADRNILLRALGTGKGGCAELCNTAVTLQPGDAFLLCSDGVWSVVPDAEITDCLSQVSTSLDWCVALEGRLHDHLAGKREDHDNYSMITGMVIS